MIVFFVFFLQLNCIGRVCFCFSPTFLSGILIIRLHIDIEG